MKKQIAVLMAAATAVTTVAPAIANADVNTHDASVSEIVDKARKALNDKYDNSKANGITIPTGSSLSKDYLNSKYIVLVNKEGQGFSEYEDSAYGEFKDYTADVTEKIKIRNGNVYGGGKWYVVDNATKLGALLENSKDAKVAIIDKGSKDGKSVRETNNKYYVKSLKKDGKLSLENDQEVSLTRTAKILYALTEQGINEKNGIFVDTLKIWAKDVDGVKFISDEKFTDDAIFGKLDEVYKIELKLTSDKEYTLELNDDAFNLEKAIDNKESGLKLFKYVEDGDNFSVKINADYTQEAMDKVVGFENIVNKNDNSIELDINNGDTEFYTVDGTSVEENLELNNIYTREDGYTSEGKDFVNGLVKSKKTPYKFNFRGTNYVLDAGKKAVEGDTEAAKKQAIKALDDNFANAIIDKSGDGYKLTFNVKVRDANDTDVTKTLKFVVKGDKQRDLYDVLRDLRGEVEVVSGHFTKLAGSNRYATAVEVSAEQFGAEEAESVVIVGGKAQLDGLAAAPLASAKNAPILLADPNTGLNRDTIKEIDRACKSLKNKTVYIVGGEQSVPAKVAKQLEDEFGAVVHRVAGANRRATSLEVAKRLNRDDLANNRVFVVGGEGAADAMSVSAVASIKSNEVAAKPEKGDNQVSPILVVDAKGVERDTREFVKTDLNKPQVKLIGGEKSLSTQVLRDFKTTAEIDDTKRISGDNRYDTNVEVIEAFYENTAKDGDKIVANGAIFASGENDYLVDAQTAGSFAANNNLPIVLAGNKLTNDQVDLMKKDGVLESKRSNIYQVGGVVSSDVMKVVVDKLDL